jgi:hypothetical protein
MNMRMHDPGIYIAREAEVIRINNQPLQIGAFTLTESEPRASASGPFGMHELTVH